MDEEIVESFRLESEEHLEAMEAELFALEKIEDPVKEESSVIESLNSAFRAAHSLKGAAVFLGFKNITTVTHAMENILGELRDSVKRPSVDCANLLFDSLDALSKLFVELYESDNIDVGSIIKRLNRYVEESERGSKLERPESDSEFSAHESLEGMYKFCVTSGNKAVLGELELVGEVLESTEDGGCYKYIVTSALEYELFSLSLEEFECEVVPYVEKAIAEEKNSVEENFVVDAPVKSEDTKSVKKIAKPMDASVRVPVALLSELMALAGELVLVRNQHLRWASECGDSSAKEISSRLDTVTTELQTSIIRTRMQPLDKVLSRLPRIVRDISIALDKKIDLDIVGREVEVDKTILESIVDPLTHLLRNSCDHGIEMPAARVAAQKDEVGCIRVAAVQESGHISICISDDGNGIDPNKIAESALKKGMVTELELMKMSSQEKISLIMLPGFSTAESVSNISGRGVGMDVVRSSIEKLGGTFEIKSEIGVGTEFLLTLPLTLAIIQSLVIAESGYKYLIPRINLEEVISLVGKNIHAKIKAVNGQEVLNYHDSLLQLVRLNEVFASSKAFDSQKREEISKKYQQVYSNRLEVDDAVDSLVLDIAVVRVGQKRFGLIIDRALETEEIVVKPLHSAQSNIKIFLGSTIMGDGATSLILDIDGIAKHALSEVHYLENEHVADRSIVNSELSQKIISFAAGSNDKFALALSFIRRIYTIKACDIQSIGGKEFVMIGEKSINIARLSKIMEYSVENRSQELYLIMPRFGKYNCGILASEIFGITDAVIDFEDSMLKRDGVLGTTFVGDKLTIFPDIYYVCERTLGTDIAGLSFKSKVFSTPKQVLIAEDTPFFRQLIKTYLSCESMVVDTASNGQEALDMLLKKQYDLLLSDIEMPIMDGLELIKEVRSRDGIKNIPAISLTSLNTDDDRRRCLQAGYDKYLAKLNREEFHDSIKKIFNMN